MSHCNRVFFAEEFDGESARKGALCWNRPTENVARALDYRHILQSVCAHQCAPSLSLSFVTRLSLRYCENSFVLLCC